ncbi:hotdog fold domain-containing protein [Pseudomonas gozinkensis]|uniref:hotdog fold domain-containing protein n=1 Tax=Pseudomonas gozinkensis TaxID=2774461 RepID=UPI001787E136|nr:hotdog fold domain-containing protein [Pseudomonas gozinkensis]
MSQFLSMFNSVGPQAFSQMACQVAPYFSTINPLVTELRAGSAQVQVPFRREITNHLGTVHAIALCNAAELAAGMMTDVSIPAGARWIPKGMTVEYLAKAKTDVTAVANGEGLDWQTEGDKIVPVDVHDAEGRKVFTARITMNVKLS